MNFIFLISLIIVFFANTYGQTCDMAVADRKDCGDITTTPDSCVQKGCCWQVTTVAGRPNCFFKNQATSGPTPTGSPSGKKLYVHMMPWFETKATNNGQWGQHWTMANKNPDIITNGQRQIAAKYYPLIDLYASGDPKVIDWQLGMMALSGVTGVLIDWPGTAKAFDYARNVQNAEAIIAGTQRHGLQFAVVYEDHNLGLAHDAGLISNIIAQGQADMAYLQKNYFNKSNYIHVNGTPLLLDFGPQTLKGGQWEQIFSSFSTKPEFLTLWNQINDAGGSAQGEFAWIFSNFIDGLNNFYQTNNHGLKFGVAYPGFNTSYAEGGWPGPTWTISVSANTFQQTLDLAFANTDSIQIATWNDYGEGTVIEPTKENGYTFLTMLQKKMGVSHTQADLEKVTNTFLGH